MSTKTHDKMIEDAVDWAKSLGYSVVEHHLGTETGADAIFENQHKERVILEVVTGASAREVRMERCGTHAPENLSTLLKEILQLSTSIFSMIERVMFTEQQTFQKFGFARYEKRCIPCLRGLRILVQG